VSFVEFPYSSFAPRLIIARPGRQAQKVCVGHIARSVRSGCRVRHSDIEHGTKLLYITTTDCYTSLHP
jgi:hypothetical protein